MKRISINNGHSYTTPAKAIKEVYAGVGEIYHMMDDEIREHVAHKYAPCTDAKFIREYLRRAKADLIIG